ncbi:hypothetical protein D3D03_16345 [Exiguobacterium sp. RIT452]|uniref:hypothetical protein n=1 Tax=Exiguobacterium sp. RIT452 TaxID=2315552 RepID=UPI000E74AF13|nr:hypothetical protein [Exiguobacterium sp. RIT452]RJO94686.1 hypothetical protein D3D03_16345 [Exiguobacterium sp. RIT452]
MGLRVNLKPLFDKKLGRQNYYTNLYDLNVKSDGVTDNSSTFSQLLSTVTYYVPPGTFLISNSCTILSNLVFAKGAVLKVATGATVILKGKINAGNQEIFEDAGGTVDLMQSENEYNLGWFKSGNNTINKRWDFAKKAMTTFARKTLRIPKPYPSQPGTELTGNRAYWLFDGELKFEDKHNSLTIYVDGEFKASAPTANLFNFEDTSKPENLYFYGDVQAIVPPSINVGSAINIKGTARVTFWGNVILNGFRTPVKIGGPDQVAPISDVRFFQLQCSFFYETAVSIYGKNGFSTQSVEIDRLTATAAQTGGLNALEIKGSIRNIKVGDVTYATDIAKNGYTANDAENVVLLESNAEGSIIKVEIDSVYQANANNGVKTATNATTPQTGDRIQYLKVRNLFAKYNGSAMVIGDCNTIEIESIHNLSDVTINASASYVKIQAGAGLRNVTDNGLYTIINNVGKQTRGGGVPPAPAVNWPIGSIIRETSDSKLYLRVAKANLASDFILLN